MDSYTNVTFNYSNTSESGKEFNGNQSNYDYSGDYSGDYIPVTDYWEGRGRIFMFTYIAPFIIILGTLGNIFSFVVLQHPSYRKTSTGFILSALAVVDTGMLNTGLLRNFILSAFGVDVRLLSEASCRIHYFLTYVFRYASPMTIALMTTERVVGVWRPFKVNSIFSRKNVAIAWSVSLLVLMGMTAHSFFTVDLFVDEYGSHCYFAEAYVNFHMGAWYWIDAIVSSYIPIILIFTGNILIIVHHAPSPCSSVTPPRWDQVQLLHSHLSLFSRIPNL